MKLQPRAGAELHLRRAVAGGGVVALGYYAVRIARQTEGDMVNHLLGGHWFVSGQWIYEGGHNQVYPPLWAMAFGPWSLVPQPLAAAGLVAVGVFMLMLLLRTVRDLARPSMPLTPGAEFWVAAGAVAIGSRAVLSDLTTALLNTTMVALAWLGVWAWRSGRAPWAAGLGLAVALKATSGVYVAWLFWKRQWRAAAVAGVAAGAFTVLPAAYVGPAEFTRQLAAWAGFVVEGVRQPDPSRGVLGDEPLQNNALKPTLARFLMTLPPGHPGRHDHPLYVDVFDVSPATAAWVIRGVQAGLVVGVLAFLLRPTPPGPRGDVDAAYEACLVGALALLVSPVTWTGHATAMLPLYYLLFREWRAGGVVSRVAWVALGYQVALTIVPSRAVVGKDLTRLLDSYGVQTWGTVLLLLAAAYQLRRRAEAGEKAG